MDLVNEKDEVIGEVERNVANSDPKYIHREVIVYIFDNENRLLMQQRSFKKKVYPGIWAESASGHIDKGESPEDAAHRELKEEMGFDTNLEFIKKRLLCFANETHFTYCYVGKYNGETIKFQTEEIEQIRFTKKEELDGLYSNIDKITENEIEWMKSIWP